MSYYTESDIEWTEKRTIALMQLGVAFLDAVRQAAEECSERILDREIQALQRLQEERDRRRSEARARQEAERAEQRGALEACGELGQRSTLKTSLEDLLAARGRK